MTEVLYTPNRERVLTSNAWAFLHWLRMMRGLHLPDWAALLQFAVDKPVDFRLAVAAFAGLSGNFQLHVPRLPHPAGETAWPRHTPAVASDEDAAGIPPSPPNSPQIHLSPATLIHSLADTLLHA